MVVHPDVPARTLNEFFAHARANAGRINYGSGGTFQIISTAQLAKIEPLYRSLREEENRHRNAKEGMMAGYEMLMGQLKSRGLAYDEFIFTV